MYPVDPSCMCVPLLGGMTVGACLANEAYKDRVYHPTPTILAAPQQTTITASNSAVLLRQESQKMLYKVVIPNGVRPGQSFLFKVGDKTYSAQCPHGAFPGEDLFVMLPVCPTIMSHPVVEPIHEELLVPAIVAFDHDIDEYLTPNRKHGIIAAKAGDRVTILEGKIETGMPAPYEEYCKVKLEKNGKVGKVSRFVLRYESPEPFRALKQD